MVTPVSALLTQEREDHRVKRGLVGRSTPGRELPPSTHEGTAALWPSGEVRTRVSGLATPSREVPPSTH